MLAALDRVADVAAVASGVTVVLMTLLVAASVATRYLFRAPLVGVDELSGYLMVVLVYFGLAYSLRTGAFIRVDNLYRLTTGRLRRALDLLVHSLALLYGIVLVVYFWQQATQSYALHSRSIGLLQTPLYVPQGAMALGMALFAFQALVGLLRVLAGEQGAMIVAAGDAGRVPSE